VFADAGYSTSLLRTFYKNFGGSAGFSLSLPIYDGGKRKLALQQVALQEDTRIGYRDFFNQQYTEQVSGLMQQLAATEALLSDIDEQIKYSRGLIEVHEKLLQTGDVRIADFVIAINNYLVAKTVLTQNRISRLQLINQISYWNR
jgi:outer membrane protein TolC